MASRGGAMMKYLVSFYNEAYVIILHFFVYVSEVERNHLEDTIVVVSIARCSVPSPEWFWHLPRVCSQLLNASM
jgi:hypothetical protein